MGVLGLWTLLDPAGKPVPVESLSHKVLAVDISIWLNQAVRGFRDKQGNAVPHAHLLGLYHRICKLLFYRIKPVFVFDGAPPQLKKDTLARRRMRRSKDSKAAKIASQKILGNYLQRQAVSQRLQRQTMAMESVAKVGVEGIHQLLRGSGKREKDLFELPDIPKTENDESIEYISSSDSETDIILENVGLRNVSDVYEVDVTSSKFTSLPTNLQYEVLNELKGKRKQNSWAKLEQMPKEAEGFSGFQMERLVRRRGIQAKLEGVVEELGQEQREVIDHKLFVGDRSGLKKLKTESKRLVSRPDREVIFMSGLRREEVDEEMEVGESSKGVSKEKEVRELDSSDDADDPDLNEAIALSMTCEGEPSQKDILDIIKNGQHKSVIASTSRVGISHGIETVDVDDDSDDEVVLIPTASLFTSNRLGGRSVIKTEIKEEVKEEVEDVEVMSESSDDGVGVMSDSEADSALSEEEKAEDLFSDIFEDSIKVKELTAIIEKAQVPANPPKPLKSSDSNPLAQELLESVSKLDKPGDILAVISNRANKVVKPSVSKPTESTSNTESNPNKDIEFTREISKSLKNGPGTMMKIASRWADAEISKPPSQNEQKNESLQERISPMKGFESEQSSLLKEMAKVEKENRLLRFTQVEYDGGVCGTTDNDVNNETKTDDKTLKKIGVKTVPADVYKQSVLHAEGIDIAADDGSISTEKEAAEQTNNKNVVYMAAVPGFVPSGRRPQTTVNVDKDDTEDGLDIPVDIPNSLMDESDELSEAELYALQARLAAEKDMLVAERSKATRLSNSITDNMYQECQEMLQMFGLPWLVAPGEAEAQCAQLDTAGLTDGTITDDSDIWLFGGTKVYKNFFDQEKYVEFFSQTELVQHFGLTREKLVCVALLTGSDYTEGVETVGPVTAMEVLAEFPGDGITPLQDFNKWSSRVKGEMGKEFGMPVGNKTREKLRKLKLPPTFPSEAVVAAYLNPSVEVSDEKFSWAVPNLVGVRDFAMDRFGWDKTQVDKLLKPVIRALQERGATRQARLENYFTSSRVNLPDKGMFASSKRVEEAIRKVRGIKSPEKPKRPANVINTKKSKQVKPTTEDVEAVNDPINNKEAAVSLIAASCGFVVAPSKDDIILQKLEREKKAKENKEKAAALFKKSQAAKKLKIQKKFKRPKRVETKGHGLSESDSE